MGVRVYNLIYEGEAVGYRLISEEDGIGLDFDREVFPVVCSRIKVDPGYIKQVYAGDIQMWYNKNTGLLEVKSMGDESRYLECSGEFMDFDIRKGRGNESVNLKAVIAYQWYLNNPLEMRIKVFVSDTTGLIVFSKGTCALGVLNERLLEQYRTSYKGNSKLMEMGEISSEYTNIPIVTISELMC